MSTKYHILNWYVNKHTDTEWNISVQYPPCIQSLEEAPEVSYSQSRLALLKSQYPVSNQISTHKKEEVPAKSWNDQLINIDWSGIHWVHELGVAW